MNCKPVHLILPLSRNMAMLLTKNKITSSLSWSRGVVSSCVMTATRSSSSTAAADNDLSRSRGGRPRALFLNASRLDYDGKLDFSRIDALCDFRRNNVDIVKDVDEIVSIVSEHEPEILITKEMKVPRKALERFPSSLRLLCEAGTGYNNLPTTTALPICNVPTYSTDAVAQLVITYLMNFSVSMLEQQRMLHRDNDRSNFTGPFTLPLNELGGKTLGLVGGSGRIGSRVADIALALGMNVIISTRTGALHSGHRFSDHPSVRVVRSNPTTTTNDDNDNDNDDGLIELLSESDYVSLHMPLNNETRGMFGKRYIERMKPTAFLINTSRGGACNENELIECLRNKTIAGAGLDVTVSEPPAEDSELWTLSNVWLTPHTGWRRIETRQRLVDMTADNIEAYCNAQTESDLINVVNINK